MKCPHCSDLLKQYRHCGQPVDMCDCCGGIWFDPGELPEAMNYLLRNHPEKLPSSSAELKRQRQDPSTVREATKICPKCSLGMDKINYMYDSNIILDRCSSCDGLWADGGEFRKVAAHSKGNPLIDSLGKTILKKNVVLQGGGVEVEDPVVAFGNTLSQPVKPMFFFVKLIFPLKDCNPTNIIPVGTLGLISLNIVLFLLAMFSAGKGQGVFLEYGLVPAQVLAGTGYYTFLSSMFLHVDIIHLLGNMYFLWIFADNVEEHLGLGGFLSFFLICGFWAGIIHVLVSAESSLPMVGASGAVAGTMGAYFYLFPKVKIKTIVIHRIIDLPAYLFIGFWVAFQIMQAFFASFTYQTSVAFSAHIGGFFSGILFIWLHEKMFKKVQPAAAE